MFRRLMKSFENENCIVCFFKSTMPLTPIMPFKGYCPHSEKFHSRRPYYRYEKRIMAMLMLLLIFANITVVMIIIVHRRRCTRYSPICFMELCDIIAGADTLVNLALFLTHSKSFHKALNLWCDVLASTSIFYMPSIFTAVQCRNSNLKTIIFRTFIGSIQVILIIVELFLVIQSEDKWVTFAKRNMQLLTFLLQPHMMYILYQCRTLIVLLNASMMKEIERFFTTKLVQADSNNVEYQIKKLTQTHIISNRLFNTFIKNLNITIIPTLV